MINNIRKLFMYLKNNGIKRTIVKCVRYVQNQMGKQEDRRFDYFDKAPNMEPIVPCSQDRTIYMVASIPYYDIGGGQRCAQLSKTFYKMGYCVRYLYNQGSVDKMDDKIMMPLASHLYIDKKCIQFVKEQAKDKDVFIFEAPMKRFEPILEIALKKGCKVVYENIDNWETTLGSGFFSEETLKKMLSSADLLVGTAVPLVDQLKMYLDRYQISRDKEKIAYLANAVDAELFSSKKEYAKPQDLVTGTKTFLYYGSLWGEWFDWDLVIGLAERHPEYSIILIGNTEGITKIVDKCPSNIHFLGLKAQVDLPAYLQYVDYTLLPFKRGLIGDYVSPLKIFEYISMHTKVLCTTLPDIQGYPNLYFGDVVDEWEKVIEKDYLLDKTAADAFIACNTWEYRVKCMLELLED